jgi:uncharacterized protein (DUF849 family)
MSRTIITVAPTGAWPTKEHNPNVPLTPKEIAADVYESWQAGAAIAHLHMRDAQGKGTMEKDRFIETVGLIREKCDIVINLTTSGDLNAADDARMAHLIELKPELASFDAGSMNWMHSSLFINHPRFLEKLGETMTALGVRPEIEVFDAGMYYNAVYYMKKGVIKRRGISSSCSAPPAESRRLSKTLCSLKTCCPQMRNGPRLASGPPTCRSCLPRSQWAAMCVSAWRTTSFMRKGGSSNRIPNSSSVRLV